MAVKRSSILLGASMIEGRFVLTFDQGCAGPSFDTRATVRVHVLE